MPSLIAQPQLIAAGAAVVAEISSAIGAANAARRPATDG
jgi:hypothetical protein